jgi:uncharacterized protein YfkK (UPF0435 family)
MNIFGNGGESVSNWKAEAQRIAGDKAELEKLVNRLKARVMKLQELDMKPVEQVDEIVDFVMKNITPSRMDLMIAEKKSEQDYSARGISLSHEGFLKTYAYSSRGSKETLSSMLVEIKPRILIEALDIAMEQLEKGKQRTKRRSIDRLQRLKSFLGRHENHLDTLKRSEFTISLPPTRVWPADKISNDAYLRLNMSSRSVGGLVVGKKGKYDEVRILNMDNDGDCFMTFMEIADRFEEYIVQFECMKENCVKDRADMLEDCRKTFSKELLELSAKKMSKAVNA